jgi:hypothetical protein
MPVEMIAELATLPCRTAIEQASKNEGSRNGPTSELSLTSSKSLQVPDQVCSTNQKYIPFEY